MSIRFVVIEWMLFGKYCSLVNVIEHLKAATHSRLY